MKKRFLVGLVGILCGVVTASADVTFVPSVQDMEDLNHDMVYLWKINAASLSGQTITGATLTFDNINDWANEAGDKLFLHLSSKADIQNAVNNHVVSTWQSDIYRGSDGSGVSDALVGYGPLLTTYSDTNGSASEDFTYTFNSGQLNALRTYVQTDGLFGIGFDPDCHYLNDGISLKVQTAVVPVPGAILLGGLGTAVVGWLRRRQSI